MRSNHLQCQRLKRMGTSQAYTLTLEGRDTPYSHLKECSLLLSVWVKYRCCCVSETNEPVVFMPLVHVASMNARTECGKQLHFKILQYTLLAYLHCTQGLSKSFSHKHTAYLDHLHPTLSWPPSILADFLTILTNPFLLSCLYVPVPVGLVMDSSRNMGQRVIYRSMGTWTVVTTPKQTSLPPLATMNYI